MLGKRVGQRRAALHVRFDGQHQFLHGRFFVTRADDLECLHQRDPRRHHGGHLPGEDCDVFRADLAAGVEKLCLLANAGRHDPLTAQLGAHRRFTGGDRLALDLLAGAVCAFPVKWGLLDGGCSSHVSASSRSPAEESL